MSRPHHAQRTSLPFGNPFRMILPKGSYLSPKLLAVLTSFEQTLAESFRKLKPKNLTDVLSFSWMSHAMASLSDAHANIKTLTSALQFPVSDWDEKWMDMYLDDSVKLLDICNALTSELSRLDQSQLLLKYALHILASSSASPSFDELGRVHSSLHDWMVQVRSRSPKLENCSSILQQLNNTLNLVKVKNSAKGKVLMRALYGVKVMSIFVCSIFTSALSGCAKPLVDVHVAGEFLWADAFNDLQAGVRGEITTLYPLGKSGGLKELEAVDAHVKKLHDLSISHGQMKEERPITDPNKAQEEERFKESSSGLAGSSKCLAQELDLISKQLEEFFHLVLAGRNTLLCGLTTSDVHHKEKADKLR